MLYNSAEIMYLVSEVNVKEKVDGIVKMEVWLLWEYHVNWSYEKKRKRGRRVQEPSDKKKEHELK